MGGITDVKMAPESLKTRRAREKLKEKLSSLDKKVSDNAIEKMVGMIRTNSSSASLNIKGAKMSRKVEQIRNSMLAESTSLPVD